MIRSLQSTFFILLAFVSLACSVPSGPAGKPAVGITYGAIQTRLLKCGIDINGEYIEALKAQGAYAVRIFVNDDQAAVRQKLASLDGVLIPGGFDIEPSRYGEVRDAACEAVDEKLDALEYTVLGYAREQGLPVLGVCRGCQMLNVFYGGSLYQDIPSQYATDAPVRHRNQINLGFYKHAVSCNHDAVVETKSIMGKLLGGGTVAVNTYHHQGVKRLARGFIVTARTADGFVEAIEGTGSQFILGTQFHPEKMLKESPRFGSIFKAFVDAVRKTLHERELSKKAG